MNSNSSKKSRKKRRIPKGAKENLNIVIANISFVTQRKPWPKEGSRDILNDAFDNTDAYLAAVGIHLPEVDASWSESGAKEAFTRIVKSRRTLIRWLISIALIISAILIGGIVALIILMEHWAKFVIVLVIVLIILIGSTQFQKIIVSPMLTKRDEAIPTKFVEECKILDKFTTDLVNLRRKI